MWTVSAELLPDSLRASGMGAILIVFWTLNFVACQEVERVMQALTPQGAMAAFAMRPDSDKTTAIESSLS